MKDYEREALLEKIDREGSFVGVDIPETIEYDGEEIELREYIFDLRSGDSEIEEVDEMKKKLRRKKLELRESIEEDELSYEEGEELAEVIAGIERALTSIKQAGEDKNLNKESQRSETADDKRWYSFLKKVTGSSNNKERKSR